MTVCRYLDTTTGHLPEGEATALRESTIEHIVADAYEYGWWVWVPPARVVDGDEREELRAEAPCLLNLIDYARAQGCDYLRLDADGAAIDGLPTFQW
ncbi:unannotated protein [freshwater metagenome]|uniref:Unannotated protein n=1 Tax=freshwater metagenome TaxID=449393 RepID=A0A6J7FHF6_9ZZZZ|nr:hypothetical protein [Actinomycetota bacterium]